MSAVADQGAAGREARKRVPRSSHAQWEPGADRPDPVALLEAEAAPRLPELVPIRHARMATSPFAFFRGAAAIMAADLAATLATGLRVQLCGDAHLANFGGFASPERRLVFDLNDFDETLPGPWEWDVKRLAASAVIACRDRGWGDERGRAVAEAAVGEYRTAMRGLAKLSPIDVWYAHIDEDTLRRVLRRRLGREEARRLDRGVAKARTKDSTRAFAKLASVGPGGARIAADPPLVTPIEDLVPAAEAREINARMAALVAVYRDTLPYERRVLLDRYRYVHAARKVVGVGSVGTRCWALLLLGREHGEPLFLQAKEAEPSALEAYAGRGEFDHEGRRVVEGQRLVQATGDIFLGWVNTTGIDGRERDFYLRQLWDWKASLDLGRVSAEGLTAYARLCGGTLARAHARTGDATAIAEYLGRGAAFDRAVAAFAVAYADQNERDHRALLDAIGDGRLVAEQPAAA